MSTAVVILNYNGAKHLSRFLPSVVMHTPATVDIIVADNGSSDDSLEIVARDFPVVKIIELERNYGFADGYNRALAELNHDYVILLNSDVEVAPNWCEPLIAELDSNPQVGAVGPKLLSYTDRTQFEYAGAAGGYIDYLGYPFCRGRILSTTEEDQGQYNDTRDLFWVSGAAFACRTDVFKNLCGFDSDFFAHMEEIDLCWRMQLAGLSVRIVPSSRVYHLGGGTLNATSPTKLKLNYRNNLAMLYKCSTTSQRIIVAIVRPMLDALSAIIYIMKGEFSSAKSVALAYRDFIAWHRTLAEKRKAIRAGRIAESKHIYRGSIVMRYMFGKHTFDSLMR